MVKKSVIIATAAIVTIMNTSINATENNNFKDNELKNNSIIKETQFNINKEIVNHAEEYLGKKYVFGGRDLEKFPGIDCLGLIFLSIEKTTGKSWKYWSVMPSKFLKQLDTNYEKTYYTDKINEKIVRESFKE